MATIEQRIPALIRLEDFELSVPCDVTAAYNPSFPWAIGLSINGTRYVLSRELLAEALTTNEVCGVGLVKLQRIDGATLMAELTDQEATILVELSVMAMTEFEDETQNLVALGEEELDVDQVLQALGV